MQPEYPESMDEYLLTDELIRAAMQSPNALEWATQLWNESNPNPNPEPESEEEKQERIKSMKQALMGWAEELEQAQQKYGDDLSGIIEPLEFPF